MAVYIDPPRWPAHGTVFSHMISDASHVELHRTAEAIGLGERAFDEDHYDVPAKMYEAAIEAGAIAVGGGELIRILRRSGLRVPPTERAERVVPLLREQWRALRPGDPALGEDLLSRWGQAHRAYHTPVHLYECLGRIAELTPTPREEVLLAAWFHDAVYDGVAGQDEERSAALARERLGGSLGREVARLVRLTIDHRVPRGDGAGAALVDADLGILAASPGRYQRYAAQIRREYSHVSPADWRRGRRAVLEDFRGRPHLFLTPRAKRDWGAAARRNLDWELGKLT